MVVGPKDFNRGLKLLPSKRAKTEQQTSITLENHSALLTLAFLLLRRSLAAAAGPTPEPRALIARKALLYPPWS